MNNTTDLDEFDRDTLDYLRAAGVDFGIVDRVRAGLAAKKRLQREVDALRARVAEVSR